MARSHFVVVRGEDGQPVKDQLKKWLRDNPHEIPPGMHPDDSTSHELRSGLKRRGWKLQFLPQEVLIIKPSGDGDTSYAEEFIDQADTESSHDDSAESEESAELKFGLERDLQAGLRADISQLEPGMSILDNGSEWTTDAGRIDILAEDRQGKAVVVELKAGRADSRAIAQILAYMSTIAAEQNRPVRGIIVAWDYDGRVVLASRAVPNLELKRYSYQFKFDTVV